MNNLTERLQELPPDLIQPSDRFEQVQAHVARRRRKRLVLASVAAVAVALLAAATASKSLLTPGTGAMGVATEPDRTPAAGAELPCDDGSSLRRVGLRQSTVVLNQRGRRLGLAAPKAVAFVRTSDLCGPTPSNPKAARRMMQHRVNDRGEIWITLFLEDGKARVGRLLVGRVN